MQLTIRGLVVFLVALPLIAAGTITPGLEWVGWGYALLVVAAFWWDWRLSGPVDLFRVSRQHDSKLNLGVDNSVTLTVTNRRPRAIEFTIRDEPPLPFVTDQLLHQGEIGARETWTAVYQVRPPQRGDYAFGDVSLRWTGPLGLVRRFGKKEAKSGVKVYPNLVEVRRYDLLLRQNRLQELGLRHTRLLGEGTEFERLREYLPDDEYRRINWKATARRQRPITMQYQTERSQNIVAMVDIGRMMQSPVGEMAKLDYVINATLFLSYVASGVGDRVGMLTFADRVDSYLAPKRGRGQFYRMLELLYAVKAQPIEPNYQQAFSYLAVKQRKRSLVIIFTDLTGQLAIDTLLAQVSLIAKKSLPLVVTISDPDIRQTAEQRPDDLVEVYRQVAAQQLLDARQIALERLKQRGVLTLDVPADQLSIAVINRYLQLKSRERI
ncbi:MAG: DUF58 domain-containing protein [Ardenticatenaceae bacterium]|nr:DUF58 domain-containing protein [Ardenticatenaceae bacterium]